MDRDNGYKAGKIQSPSNVTRIARAMLAEDDAKHPQIVYYQAGIGTGLGMYEQLLGGGTGLGLSEVSTKSREHHLSLHCLVVLGFS